MRFATSALVVSAVCLFFTNGFAQVPQEPRPVSNAFAQLFPNPSGANGYEEFVRAGDLASNSDACIKFENGDGFHNLSEMRLLLIDPGVRQALLLVRAGLRKPVTSAHPVMDDETLLPEMALCRRLARLISVEIYVQMADGKMGDAISSLGDCLKFSYLIHRDSLIGGL